MNFKKGDRIRTKSYYYIMMNSHIWLDKKNHLVKLAREGFTAVPFMDAKNKAGKDGVITGVKNDLISFKPDDDDNVYLVSTWMIDTGEEDGVDEVQEEWIDDEEEYDEEEEDDEEEW